VPLQTPTVQVPVGLELVVTKVSVKVVGTLLGTVFVVVFTATDEGLNQAIEKDPGALLPFSPVTTTFAHTV